MSLRKGVEMRKTNSLALEQEREHLKKILYEESTKFFRYRGNDAAVPCYSKLLLAGQVVFFVVLLISVLPNVSFLLDWNQPMKKGAFAVTAVCMAGLMILLVVHIALNARHWIGCIQRETALNRLRKEIKKRLLEIEKELEENRKVYPDYEFTGDQWSNNFTSGITISNPKRI